MTTPTVLKTVNRDVLARALTCRRLAGWLPHLTSTLATTEPLTHSSVAITAVERMTSRTFAELRNVPVSTKMSYHLLPGTYLKSADLPQRIQGVYRMYVRNLPWVPQLWDCVPLKSRSARDRSISHAASKEELQQSPRSHSYEYRFICIYDGYISWQVYDNRTCELNLP